MRKVLRYFLILLGLVAVAAGGFAAFVAIRGIPKYKAEKIELKIEATPARLAQGKKLASMLCASCHMDPKTAKLTGKKMDEAAQFGEIYSKNITQHPQYGIGNWTDGELVYLLRTGLKPDGTYLPPYMAKLPNMSDEDLYSIIAFLRSDHEWVKPDPTVQPPTKPSFFTKFLSNVGVVKPFPFPKAAIMGPDTTDKVKWGRYIALAQMECFSCHSNDFAKNDYFTPEKSAGFFGGGNKMTGANGKEIVTSNLSPDEETGIGRWTEQDFIKAVKYGQKPHGQGSLRAPMAPYSQLTDEEVKAVFAYLKTVPKIKNKVDRNL